MQDLEIKGTGNSRFLKSSVPATTTWEDFLTMLRAGNLPIDLTGLNSAGIITQNPSAYNKANVLPDDVCSALGIDPQTSEPKDAFLSILDVPSLYVWGKYSVTDEIALGQLMSGVVIDHASTTSGELSTYYANEIELTEDGSLQYSGNAQKLTLSYSSYLSASILKGKYWGSSSTVPQNYTPFEADNPTRGNDGMYYVAIPAQSVSVQQGKEYIETVSSKNPDAYPSDGEQGEYWYKGGYILAAQSPDIGRFTGQAEDKTSSYSLNISLGYRPKAVLVFDPRGYASFRDSYAYCRGGLALDGYPLTADNTSIKAIEITEDGFIVRSGSYSNTRVSVASGVKYFLAWR